MWVFLALITALFTSFKDVCGRIALGKSDHYIVAWAWTACSLPFLLVYVLIDGVPEIGPNFWFAALGSTIILSIAAVLFFRAIKVSDLSIAVPMLAFTPAFLLITSPLMIKEFPEPVGILGIFLIVAGSYVLNFSKRDQGFWEPFRCLLKNEGSRLMLYVSMLYSVGANFDKIGVLNSSPGMWIFSLNFFVSIVLSVVVVIFVKNPVRSISRSWRVLILMGLFTSIALVCQMYAIRLTIVPYVIALKRTSVVMTALFGLFLFKERGFGERFVGVALMVFGVFIISFFTAS